MAGQIREHALPLLAAVNNHGDLTVKLSSLKRLKEILLSAESSQVAELLPYLIDLQSSPECLVRKGLIEVIEAVGMKAKDHSLVLMPVLFACLKDMSSMVAKQSIISGMKIFCGVLEELSYQFHRHGIVERWLEELWTWMVKFKDSVFGFLFEAGPIGAKLLALKFLETYILLFTSDANDSEKSVSQAKHARTFNITWVVGHHPVLDAGALTSDANNTVGILLDLLCSASSLPGLLTISVINSLAVIARRRPVHYKRVFSALLDFDPNFEMTKGGHAASIQYSLRTAFLGFLRCTHPAILESRERLLKSLRAMNAGDAADQVLRQLDKMMRNNERASRDSRLSKDDQSSDHLPISGDITKKRSTPLDNEDPSNNYDFTSKRAHYGLNNHIAPPVGRNDSGKEYVNGVDPKVENMIAMIGAFIAAGERGANSLEFVISGLDPDMLADIVIANMKHLPKNPPPLARVGSVSLAPSSDSSNISQVMAPIDSSLAPQAPVPGSQAPISLSTATNASLSEVSTSASLPTDSKRDPRRDPRRLDPRRAAVAAEVSPTLVSEDNTSPMQSAILQPEINTSNVHISIPMMSSSECMPMAYRKLETDSSTTESSLRPGPDLSVPKEEVHDEDQNEGTPDWKIDASTHIPLSSPDKVEQELVPEVPCGVGVTDEIYSPPLLETDQLSPPISTPATPEDACGDLPALPPFIELTHEQQRSMGKLAIEQIIDSYKKLKETDDKHTGMALLSRLVAQIHAHADADADADVLVMIQRHIFSDYQHQKVHELAMHVLYHLNSLMLSDSAGNSSPAAALYEKFLLSVAKSLLESLPANDKSFSRLLGEVPYLPESVMRLLVDLCSENYVGKDGRDGDRVTQGLGAVWSLILGRPPNRQPCLDIALKCAIHPQDDVRAKAIRLVANKLYVLGDISDSIEQFAKNMFLRAIEQHVTDAEYSQSETSVRRTGETGNQEASVSGSQISEPGFSENDSVKSAVSDSQSDSEFSFAQAQRLISLLFALCTKKPTLLHLVFDSYARAPKAVKQAVHRHMPVLIRAIGSSCSELLRIISDPPQGCENLLTQVLHILSEGTTPPPDLVAVVKRLYETKLKDATVLIPVLSSFSRSEVLPVFPRLVALPLDKFQIALARILQGSAHTGPALTPAEVLVAIHDINPERDGLPLKKITDACSACFEQRTVFTQQVLAKALRQMVDQTPLPLLFMRTVIQAIDAFPSLVDFVMEILSKLVIKQVWRMPKLWVGFLKCVSQTQPHSFPVLLQLPPPQLESALNKYSNLRSPLASFANQPNIKNSLPRSTLVQLGLLNESNLQQPHLSSSMHASETGSSVHGTTLT